MGQYSIKEIESISGVKAHTLRIWEQRYDFLKPKRTDTNIRYYTDEQMRLLLNIGTLNRHGMKISKIAELERGELSKHVLDIYQSTQQPDDMMDALVHAMIDFDEARFEHTLYLAINKLGFEKAFVQLVFPFMVRTGVLWATGAINVAQEHFVTNLLRRKIVVAIDSLHPAENKKAKKFVLFLPEGEVHDLLLLFTEYILRSQGHLVYYLGAAMPVSDLRVIIRTRKPDFLVTFLTLPLAEPLADYARQVLKDAGDLKFVIGGSIVEEHKGPLPSNCVRVHSAADLAAVIA